MQVRTRSTPAFFISDTWTPKSPPPKASVLSAKTTLAVANFSNEASNPVAQSADWGTL
jgi:hypothetical protein